MSRPLSALLLVSLLVPAPPPKAQSPTPATPSPTTLLQNALTALVGVTTLSDITLSGSIRHIAGSTDETGTATLQAASNGSANLALTFPASNNTEIENLFADPVGAWSGTDGVSHPIAFHNLLAEPAWFSPTVAIARRLSGATYVSTYVAHETLNGQAVEHISVSQTPLVAEPPGSATFAHLSQVDFYLDSTTFLPAAISFNLHPDDNALLDIPVQILFSDYRSVSGTQIPFHVQKFLNNSLLLDVQFSSASINSGLSASNFPVATTASSTSSN